MTAGPGAAGPDPLDPEALERALARLERPAARKSFRMELRESFVSGFEDGCAGRSESVSETYENPAAGASRNVTQGRRPGAGSTDALQEPVEEHIRQEPLAPPARPEFRALLRAEFLAGRESSAERRSGRLQPVARRGRFRLLLGGLALTAAAAALVVLAGPGFDGGEPAADPSGVVLGGGWRVASSDQEVGLVRVDGNLLSLGDRARIEAAWNAGQQLEAADRALELVHPDGLRLSLQPGTLTRLGEDRDVAARPAWSLDLERGEILLATNDGYTGRPISFKTLDSSVLVTGTALSVMSGERGTCICVHHGSVVVHCLKSDNRMHVGDEETCFVYNDRRPSFEGPFCEAEKEFGEDMREDHLEQLRSFSQ